MSAFTFTSLLLLSLLAAVRSDVYSHNPRGSNNRLNENTSNRKNANRLFDSQNNNKGGYNVGDATAKAAGGNKDLQYQMKYFQSSAGRKLGDTKGGSYLKLEWTNQHGCGGRMSTDPGKKNCNLVLQYMCQKNDGENGLDELRAGTSTNTQEHAYNKYKYENMKKVNEKKKSNVAMNKGLHENWEWYDKCYYRERNGGLFTADQKLKAIDGYKRAIHTRQNPNGNRRGYECPEERDYYPYWHPTPWIDIAVLAENRKLCYKYQRNSFNDHPYEECVEFYPDGQRRHRSKWNNKADCEENSGKWLKFNSYIEKSPEFTTKISCNKAKGKSGINYIWGIPWDTVNVSKQECLVGPLKPGCRAAPRTRSNHLGNGLRGEPNYYNWRLPHFPSGNEMRCVYRIRYNISTDDYNPHRTTSEQNQDDANGIKSPIQGDPIVDFAGQPLQLAINTAQFGRTFQDRSHVFILKPRPAGEKLPRIFNLNVRGKRGNIVQVYPAVEYDFMPNRLTIKSDDLVHIQWTGSNTHNNKNDGADGEGTAGTDRSNLLEMYSLSESYPLPFEKTLLWNISQVVWIHHGRGDITPADLALDMASAGYYNCVSSAKCTKTLKTNSLDKKTKMDNLLNNAPASYGGALLRIKKGKYYYMCTRNNNFTNRSQKGCLIVY